MLSDTPRALAYRVTGLYDDPSDQSETVITRAFVPYIAERTSKSGLVRPEVATVKTCL